jgi:hypothetical protein
LRCSLLAILLGLFSQSVGGQKSLAPPAIYLLRAVFKCTENMDLEGCSAADLKKVGWSDQSAARNELAEFTALVLAEAQRQQARVKKITCNTSMPLKVREGKLVEDWRRLGARETARPWIIEMQIKVEGGHSYYFTIQARRAGQDDFLYPEHYKSPEWGEFTKIIRERHFPDLAKLVTQVGCDILNDCEER